MGSVAKPESLDLDIAGAAALRVLAKSAIGFFPGAIGLAIILVPGLDIALKTAGVPLLTLAPEAANCLAVLAAALDSGAFAGMDLFAPFFAGHAVGVEVLGVRGAGDFSACKP